jgi:hypothetical protein
MWCAGHGWRVPFVPHFQWDGSHSRRLQVSSLGQCDFGSGPLVLVLGGPLQALKTVCFLAEPVGLGDLNSAAG